MEKKIIEEVVFQKQYNGIRTRLGGDDLAEVVKHLQPGYHLDWYNEEPYYSENNSYDGYTRVVVMRERLETDEEFEKRKVKSQNRIKEATEKRREQFLKLKEEFEPTVDVT